jgi:hypothetical protein
MCLADDFLALFALLMSMCCSNQLSIHFAENSVIGVEVFDRLDSVLCGASNHCIFDSLSCFYDIIIACANE